MIWPYFYFVGGAEMKKLEKIRFRGAHVPNSWIWLKGFIHGKQGIVSWEGDFKRIIRSSYLYEGRYAYIEYKEKLLRLTQEQIEPHRTKSFEIQAKKNMDEEKLQAVQQKIESLDSPVAGNEYRARLVLDAEKEKLLMAISEADAVSKGLTEKITFLETKREYLLEEKLSILLRKSYIYVTGAQSSCKSKGFYLKSEDQIKEVFQDLVTVNTDRRENYEI